MEDLDERLCDSFQAAVELVGKRWTGAIIAVLRPGPLRYAQITQAVRGVSERLLSERLKELELVGIVVRRVLPGPPVGVEYELSPAGHDLGEALDALGAWAQRWMETGQVAAAQRRAPVGRAIWRQSAQS